MADGCGPAALGMPFFRPPSTGRVSCDAIMDNPFKDNDFELTTDCADYTDNYAGPIAVENGEWRFCRGKDGELEVDGQRIKDGGGRLLRESASQCGRKTLRCDYQGLLALYRQGTSPIM